MNKVNINFPKTIKVGGFFCRVMQNYKFDYSDPPLMGKYEPTSREIQLTDTIVNEENKKIVLDVATKWSTFFHELHHAMAPLLGNAIGYGKFAGETLEKAEERVTEVYAEAWLTILRDNPELCRAIGRIHKDFEEERKSE